MSRPVYEPSYARTDRKLGFSADQLFRRPARSSPGTAIYEIKVFPDDVLLGVADDLFVWEIPEDLDQAAIVKVEAYISTAGSSDTNIQIRAGDPCDTGTDILSTPITIDSGECNSRDASVQPVVIDPTVVSWGDHLHIDVDAAGTGTKGLGVIVTLAPAALAAVVLAGAQGPQGAPGGITAWTGQWQTATAYTTDQSVSNNGSSYAAIQDHTSGTDDDEPGVGANWETYWQLLAAAASSGASADGWTTDAASWVYASATTFTVAGVDVTAQFNKGTRLRLKQGGGYKYFVVTDSVFSTDTTVTVTAGTSYTIANAAITDNYYSYQANPQGWPTYFTYTPVWSSNGTQPTVGNGSLTGYFMVVGSQVWATARLVVGTTSTLGSGIYALGVPIGYAVRVTSTGYLLNSAIKEYIGSTDNGLTGSDIVIRFQTDSSGIGFWDASTPFTMGNADEARITSVYIMV